jgi:putative membrane protein
MNNSILIFIKGLLMGAANIIPGVSGATIALITGVYERLIKALISIKPGFVLDFARGDFKKGWEQLKAIDFGLLIPLGFGISLAVFSMSSLINFMLDKHQAISYAFFFGLILASAVVLYKKVHPFSIKEIPFSILGAGVSFVVILSPGLQLGHSLTMTFFSGMIAIIAMILPGISGSFILMLIGQYEFMTNAIQALDLPIMGVFIAGAVLGLLGFSRVLNYILDRWENYTMYLLIGLMVGALLYPVQMIAESMVAVWKLLAAALIGFLMVVFINAKA